MALAMGEQKSSNTDKIELSARETVGYDVEMKCIS